MFPFLFPLFYILFVYFCFVSFSDYFSDVCLLTLSVRGTYSIYFINLSLKNKIFIASFRVLHYITSDIQYYMRLNLANVLLCLLLKSMSMFVLHNQSFQKNKKTSPDKNNKPIVLKCINSLVNI